jgi:hypothetical protein
MPLGLGILPVQPALAAVATHGCDGDHNVHVFDRHLCPRLSLVAGLPARLTSTRRSVLPLICRLKQIARWAPRQLARVLLPMLHQVLNGRLQSLDSDLQRAISDLLGHRRLGIQGAWV